MTSSQERPLTSAGSAIVALIVVVAVALAVLMVFPQVNDEAEPTAPGSPVVASGEATQVTVTVEGMSFQPAVIEVPVGNTLEVTLHNTGDQRHDLEFANGVTTSPVAPGASQTVQVGVIDADSEGWCTLPGHRQMGMTLDVVAVGAEETGTEQELKTENHSEHHANIPGVPTMDQLIAQAKETDPYPAQLGPLPTEADHHYTFTVTEDEDELARGVVRPLWTYNGTSPGPILHGKIGDTFTITLENAGTMGHSVDFHAGDIAPDQPMRTIEPGESLEYVFTAKRSGIWMYHCGTMPMSVHIANGMFGAVIIEPDDLEPVDQSYVLIQSDIYLDTDESSAAEKAAELSPDLMSFNGRPFQYDAHPLQSRVGERVRFWILNDGPNAPLAFHIVGTQFDTVWSEGAYSVYRGQSTDGITKGETGAQVLSLMAAEGGFVEVQPHEAGNYAIVNHVMSLAEKGAHGILSVSQ